MLSYTLGEINISSRMFLQDLKRGFSKKYTTYLYVINGNFLINILYKIINWN